MVDWCVSALDSHSFAGHRLGDRVVLPSRLEMEERVAVHEAQVGKRLRRPTSKSQELTAEWG